MNLEDNMSMPNQDNYVDGLYIKDGRLINSRPDAISGISKAAMMKRSRDKMENIDMITAAIQASKTI